MFVYNIMDVIAAVVLGIAAVVLIVVFSSIKISKWMVNEQRKIDREDEEI